MVTKYKKGSKILPFPKRAFVTGAAGFIGFHLSKILLEDGFLVHGYDAVTDYYDPKLKEARISVLSNYDGFSLTRARLEDSATLAQSFERFEPSVLIHLAAQAGVRYSLEQPHEYISSNIVGTLNILEAVRNRPIRHLLLASTSSVYGANREMPFNEQLKSDTPLTLYAATKKNTEHMSHVYSHLWNQPVTVFRFFTVYGPWGRPDMALFKFVQSILDGKPIDVYNYGDMYRDFTFVTDLVHAVKLLINVVPESGVELQKKISGDTLSDVAPWRVVNIGNSNKVRLLDFIEEIESALGMACERNMLPMQAGDVPSTWADASLLKRLVGYQPSTNVQEGVQAFINWYKTYYKK